MSFQLHRRCTHRLYMSTHQVHDEGALHGCFDYRRWGREEVCICKLDGEGTSSHFMVSSRHFLMKVKSWFWSHGWMNSSKHLYQEGWGRVSSPWRRIWLGSVTTKEELLQKRRNWRKYPWKEDSREEGIGGSSFFIEIVLNWNGSSFTWISTSYSSSSTCTFHGLLHLIITGGGSFDDGGSKTWLIIIFLLRSWKKSIHQNLLKVILFRIFNLIHRRDLIKGLYSSRWVHPLIEGHPTIYLIQGVRQDNVWKEIHGNRPSLEVAKSWK